MGSNKTESKAPEYPTTSVSSNGLFGSATNGAFGSIYQPTEFDKSMVDFSQKNSLPLLQEYINPNYDSEAFHQSDDYYTNKMNNLLQNNYLNPALSNNLLRGSTAQDIYRGFASDLANTEYERQQDYKNQQLANYQAAMMPYQTAFNDYATVTGLGNSLNNAIANYNLNSWAYQNKLNQQNQASLGGIGSLLGGAASLGSVGLNAYNTFGGGGNNMFGSLGGNQADAFTSTGGFRDTARNIFNGSL